MDELAIVLFLAAGACIVEGSREAAMLLIGAGLLVWFWGD